MNERKCYTNAMGEIMPDDAEDESEALLLDLINIAYFAKLGPKDSKSKFYIPCRIVGSKTKL
jgi:hypothetical protein